MIRWLDWQDTRCFGKETHIPSRLTHPLPLCAQSLRVLVSMTSRPGSHVLIWPQHVAVLGFQAIVLWLQVLAARDRLASWGEKLCIHTGLTLRLIGACCCPLEINNNFFFFFNKGPAFSFCTDPVNSVAGRGQRRCPPWSHHILNDEIWLPFPTLFPGWQTCFNHYFPVLGNGRSCEFALVAFPWCDRCYLGSSWRSLLPNQWIIPQQLYWLLTAAPFSRKLPLQEGEWKP